MLLRTSGILRVCALALLVLALVASALTGQVANRSCSAGDLHAQVLELNDRRHLSFLSAVSRADGTVAYAANTFNDPFRAEPRRDFLALFDSRGRAIAHPVGSFSFLFPKLIADADGSLHLLWGEPASTGPVRAAASPIGSLWTARLKPDGTWSSAERLRDGGVFWGKHFVDLPVGPTPNPSVVSSFGLRLLRHSLGGERAVSTSFLNGRLVAATSVAGSEDRLVVGLLGPVPPQPDVNSVSLSFLYPRGGGQDGRTVLVSKSGLHPAHNLRVRLDSASAHALWIQASASGDHSIRHVLIRDFGETMSPPTDVPLHASFGDLAVALDRCGRLHAVVETEKNSDETELKWFVFDSEWKEMPRIESPVTLAEPVLLARPDGALVLLAFAATPNDAGTDIVTVTLVSPRE